MKTILKNWNINEDYDAWWNQEMKKIKESNSLIGNNLTHELKFYHFGSRVDFYLDNELYTSVDGSLLLNPEAFKINHNFEFWKKLLKQSKRIN